MGSRNDCSLLLLLTGILLGRGSSSSDSNLRLLVLGNRKSLTGRSETVKSVATLAADVSVRMVSHVGSDLASGALTFQSLDLAGSFDVVVVEESEGSLLMLVLYLLGLGVDLLLSLSLTTVKSNNNVDACLSLKTCLFDGQFIVESGGVEDDLVYWVLDLLLDLRSKQIKELGKGRVHYGRE